MNHIRNIKPEFFTDEDVANLGPLCRLLFIALFTMADRAGRLEHKPGQIKANSLPYDAININTLIDELATARFLIPYEVGGRRYLQIRTFGEHQRPNHREPASRIPPPPEELWIAPTLPSGVGHGEPETDTPGYARAGPGTTAGKGREGKGREEEQERPGGPGLVVASLLEQTLCAFKTEWEHRYHAEYVPSAADKSSLGRLLRDLPATVIAQLPACFSRYLADEDPFIAGARRHDLWWFCAKGQGWNKYRVVAPVLSGREATTLAAGQQWLEMTEGRRSPHGRH
jgi:hypothetical protein